MKVYVITRGIYSDYTIMGVTLDQTKAKKMEKVFSDSMYDAVIEEYETDDFDWIEKPMWYVCFYRDREPSVFRDVYMFCMKNPRVKEVHYPSSTQEYTVYIQADDEKHALKVAEDELAIYKAQKAGIV